VVYCGNGNGATMLSLSGREVLRERQRERDRKRQKETEKERERERERERKCSRSLSERHWRCTYEQVCAYTYVFV
jgi:hypothetical protein